jgi:hypothetical protein
MPTSRNFNDANLGDLKPSSQNNPCPICGRTRDGDCRIGKELVLCHHGSSHHPPNGVQPGEVPASCVDTSRQWAYTGETKDGRASIYVVDKPRPAIVQARPPVPFRAAATSNHDAKPTAPVVALARLPEPGPEPPPSWPNGKELPYSDTQLVRVAVDGKGKKRPCPRHRSTNGSWISNAGSVPWPLWREAEALEHGPGQWIAEAEGEKCAEWLRAGGLVAISQPGHNHTTQAIETRYRRLGEAGIAGIGYLADNDDQGKKKAQGCADAAAEVGLAFVAIHACDVWSGLPRGGSIDDAPGTATERAETFERAVIAEPAPAAGKKQQGRSAPRGPARCRRLRPDEVLELLPERLGTLRFNVRTRDIETDKGPLSANQISRLYLQLSNTEETWLKETTADAITELATRNSYDPVAEYLNVLENEPLPMDQWERLDRHLLGIDDPIAAAFLTRYLISAVARVFDPGCSVRQIPVLVGAQWRGKTALGRILFGADHWVEGVGKLDRDDLMKAGTAWGVELAELDGVTRRSDQEHLKAFLTETVDTYRAPYDRAPERHHRRFVFWATSNGPPLRDATGSTRFVCINLPDRMLPLQWAQEHRSAIWARAVEQYQSGVNWDHCSEEDRQSIAIRNADFQEIDPWSGQVEAYLSSRESAGILPVQTTEVLTHLEVPIDRQNNLLSKRARQLAESLGWKYDRRRHADTGERLRGLWPEPPGPPGPTAGQPPGHPENPAPAMDIPPWAIRTTQVEKRGKDYEWLGACTDASTNDAGSFPLAGWTGRPRTRMHCSARNLDNRSGGPAGGPRVVQQPEQQSTQVGLVASPPASLPAGVKLPSAEMAAQLAGRLQQEPGAATATLALYLDPEGTGFPTGRQVKLWIDAGLAGAAT